MDKKFNINKYRPCVEAVKWYKKFHSFEDAWKECQRGDWLLWVASKLKVDKRTLIFAKGKCVESITHLMKDQRSINSVKVAIRYGEGKATDEELKNAAYTAADAYADAYADAADAADAAYTAADAYADAYTDAAYAATAAAYTAATDAAAAAVYTAADADAAYAAAAYAADAAAVYAAKKENQILTANICREILTKDVLNIIVNQEGVENG